MIYLTPFILSITIFGISGATDTTVTESPIKNDILEQIQNEVVYKRESNFLQKAENLLQIVTSFKKKTKISDELMNFWMDESELEKLANLMGKDDNDKALKKAQFTFCKTFEAIVQRIDYIIKNWETWPDDAAHNYMFSSFSEKNYYNNYVRGLKEALKVPKIKNELKNEFTLEDVLEQVLAPVAKDAKFISNLLTEYNRVEEKLTKKPIHKKNLREKLLQRKSKEKVTSTQTMYKRVKESLMKSKWNHSEYDIGKILDVLKSKD